ncbi:hypothetical protein LX36DRAFT_361258 [Colletotrichum falcatum]|nr:hypothetical protein LX36DRAFT_361258 [Colletotrichum falcatum]
MAGARRPDCAVVGGRARAKHPPPSGERLLRSNHRPAHHERPLALGSPHLLGFCAGSRHSPSGCRRVSSSSSSWSSPRRFVTHPLLTGPDARKGGQAGTPRLFWFFFTNPILIRHAPCHPPIIVHPYHPAAAVQHTNPIATRLPPPSPRLVSGHAHSPHPLPLPPLRPFAQGAGGRYDCPYVRHVRKGRALE